MDYPKPYRKFGEFLVAILAAVWLSVVFWHKGYWIVVAGLFVWFAIEAGQNWLEELDKSKHYRREVEKNG